MAGCTWGLGGFRCGSSSAYCEKVGGGSFLPGCKWQGKMRQAYRPDSLPFPLIAGMKPGAGKCSITKARRSFGVIPLVLNSIWFLKIYVFFPDYFLLTCLRSWEENIDSTGTGVTDGCRLSGTNLEKGPHWGRVVGSPHGPGILCKLSSLWTSSSCFCLPIAWSTGMCPHLVLLLLSWWAGFWLTHLHTCNLPLFWSGFNFYTVNAGYKTFN